MTTDIPEPVVAPTVRIAGAKFHPERVGVLRNEDGAWEELPDECKAPRPVSPIPVLPEHSLDQTVRNPEWLKQNGERIRNLFPETFTHPANLNFLKVRFNIKLYGVDYRSEDEFIQCLVALDKANLIQVQDGLLIRRGPKP